MTPSAGGVVALAPVAKGAGDAPLLQYQNSMILPCPSCGARFMVPDERITKGGVKVRCPKCHFVFIMKQQRRRPAGEEPPGPHPVRRRRRRRPKPKPKARPQELTAQAVLPDELARIADDEIVDMDEIAQVTSQKGSMVAQVPAELLAEQAASGPSIIIDDSLTEPPPEPAAPEPAVVIADEALADEALADEALDEEPEEALGLEEADDDFDIDIDVDEAVDVQETVDYVEGTWGGEGEVVILPENAIAGLDLFEGLLVEERRAVRQSPVLKVISIIVVVIVLGALAYLAVVTLTAEKKKGPAWHKLSVRDVEPSKIQRAGKSDLVRVTATVANGSSTETFTHVHVTAEVEGKSCKNYAPCGPKLNKEEIADLKRGEYHKLLRIKARDALYSPAIRPGGEQKCEVILFCGDDYRTGDDVKVTVDTEHSGKL